ncbi:MAG TPA: hypothetical protein VEL11_02225 [Candidatus Bathyarchaeia archaeon]|nr:hypothetical protein [Candidatus Bathyarchaeia archaeon]
MPKSDELYPRKEPHLQMRILKSIALKGRLSQKKAAEEFRCKPSTISEAFKIMINRTKLIQITAPDVDRQSKWERFYKLSALGLLTFIKKNPSPYEFWVAMIWYGMTLNPESADRDEFNQYYNLFIERCIGEFTLHSCFFLGDLFEKLFQRWRKQFGYNPNYYVYGLFPYPRSTYYMQKKIRNGTRRGAYNVLECLLLNRGITIDKIIELTKLEEEEVRKVIQDYSLTQTRYLQFIDELFYQPDRSEGIIIDFLNHLLIVPVRAQEDGKDENYELSLLGILLVLTTISLKRRVETNTSNTYINHYDTAAKIYQEKLPLVFGKWRLLKETLHFDRFPSLFDYLFIDKSEILSLSVSLGGNKEIYDNIRAAGLRTVSKFSIIHNEGIHALRSVDYPKEFRNTSYYGFIQEKINEIEISLKYTDISSFRKYMISKKNVEPNLAHVSLTFEHDLHFIEESLKDDFSFSFYIGLLRENNHLASRYPLTTEFMRPDIGFVYPKDLLNRIAASDDQISKRLKGWIKESKSYQKLTLEKMEDIYLQYSR